MIALAPGDSLPSSGFYRHYTFGMGINVCRKTFIHSRKEMTFRLSLEGTYAMKLNFVLRSETRDLIQHMYILKKLKKV